MVVPLTNPDANFVAQATGVAGIFVWVFVTSIVLWGILRVVMGIRVSEQEEYEGVDIAECGLEAYPEFTGRN
jgi:Amt family ammonium transporter